MSTSVDVSFSKSYETEVKQAYQRMGSKIRARVRSKSNVKGSSTTFQTVGKGTPTTKVRHGQITPMNVSHTPVECTLTDFYAGDWVDKLDEAKVNHDERRVLVQAGASALGRKTDELIITALDTTTVEVAAGGTGLTLAKIMSAMETLGGNDVFEDGQMTAVVPWNEWTDLLQIEQFASADYAKDNYPLLKGSEARFFLGTVWMPHSGLESLVSGGESRSYWFNHDAVGHASGADIKSDVTWHGDRAAWFVNNMMSQGAVLIDGNGVVEIKAAR
jgi:hypothetical protein